MYKHLDKRTKTSVGTIVVLALFALLIWVLAEPSAIPGINIEQFSTTKTSTSATGVKTVLHESDLTVAQIVANLPNVSSFRSYFTSTGVSSMVTGAGPYTVFVPVNSAFGALKTGTISNLSSAEKKRFVEYHVVSGRAIDIASLANSSIQTLSKDALNFTVNLEKNVVSVQSASVIDEYKGSNGIVYVISSVLLPPYTPKP